MTRLQWLGFALGLVGIGLVLWERLTVGGVTAGALACVRRPGRDHRRRPVPEAVLHRVPIWPGAVIQYAAATVLVGVGALLVESAPRIEWTPKVVGGLIWMVLVLSIGAVSLLMLVIRRMSAARTASLLYLTPPLAALEAYLVFGEELHARAIAGLGVAALGVFLVVRGDPAAGAAAGKPDPVA